MQKIVPNLWFNGNAAEAGEFYAAAFPGATAEVTGRYPDEGLPEFQRALAGEPVTVAVVIEGFRLTLINAGGEFAPNPAVSFMLNFDPLQLGDEQTARDRLDAVWAALADGGTVLMPLDEYPYSPRYGWLQDRYGVSWQLLLADPSGGPRPFVVPQLLFSGPAQNRAKEAIDFYTSVFGDAAPGFFAPYPEQTGPAAPGSAMFSDFTLEGQTFAAMDSGVEQDFTFGVGNSFEVRCADQAEIDRLWESLSAVPQAEQCGWLVDRFGLSWQIVPADMDVLLRKPGAYQRMLEMKKLVIADF
ncbi:VOC family protein [Microbacterium terricola]|uniref:PhnB-like domain-containing protein n=2 Tax=Microbacterium terricola TaxID=344163 RepID=A0ABM8E3K3_9MICO|nr:VOC family protein [Microbacterium terricola]UYK41644.1 VOC family protein [Microbacterium terricola]BDV32369.1 hypothetical protein Microterr_30290 [Microbacterium terricola]